MCYINFVHSGKEVKMSCHEGSEIREIFSRFGGSIGAPWSVMYMFTRGNDGGYITTMPFPITDSNQQEQLQKILDVLNEHDDVEEVFCTGEWEGKE